MAPNTITPGIGGSHTINEAGEVSSVAPTQEHPEGNRARGADGKPVDIFASPVVETPPQPVPEKPRRKNTSAEQ